MTVNLICSTPDCGTKPIKYLESLNQAFCGKCCDELHPDITAVDISSIEEVEGMLFLHSGIQNITIEGTLVLEDDDTTASLVDAKGVPLICDEQGCYKPITKYNPSTGGRWCGECSPDEEKTSGIVQLICQNDGCYKRASQVHPVHEYGWCGQCEVADKADFEDSVLAQMEKDTPQKILDDMNTIVQDIRNVQYADTTPPNIVKDVTAMASWMGEGKTSGEHPFVDEIEQLGKKQDLQCEVSCGIQTYPYPCTDQTIVFTVLVVSQCGFHTDAKCQEKAIHDYNFNLACFQKQIRKLLSTDGAIFRMFVPA